MDRIRRMLTRKRLLVLVAAAVTWVVIYQLSHFAAVLILVGLVMGLPALVLRESRDFEVGLFSARSRLLDDDPSTWPRE